MSAYNVVLGVAQSNQRVPHARTRRRRRRLRRSPSPRGPLSRTGGQAGDQDHVTDTPVRMCGLATDVRITVSTVPSGLRSGSNMMRTCYRTPTTRIRTSHRNETMNETHAAVKTRASFVT